MNAIQRQQSFKLRTETISPSKLNIRCPPVFSYRSATDRLKHQSASQKFFCLPNRIPIPSRRSRQVGCDTRHLLHSRTLVINACDSSIAPSVLAGIDDRKNSATKRLKTPSLHREIFLSHQSFCQLNHRVTAGRVSLELASFTRNLPYSFILSVGIHETKITRADQADLTTETLVRQKD